MAWAASGVGIGDRRDRGEGQRGGSAPPRRSASRRVVLLATVGLLASAAVIPRPAAAQVPRATPAVVLTSLTREQGVWRYQYRLIAYTPRGGRVGEMMIRVTSPKRSVAPSARQPMGGIAPPVMLGTQGAFLGDWIASHVAEEDSSHAPLYMGIPPRWYGALYRQGWAVWGAESYAPSARPSQNFALPGGRVLDGFELRSPAVPALRRFAAPVERPLGPPTEQVVVDSSWVVHVGVVPGPGWEADQVDGGYLQSQIEIGARERLLDTPGRYLRLADAIRRAEGRLDDRGHAAAVRAFQAYLAQDRVSTWGARSVLGATVEALLAHPPSRRALRSGGGRLSRAKTAAPDLGA